MMTTFLPSDKTGDIVTRFPQSSTLFKKHRIDFCCGGNRPIGEVAKEKGLDVEAFLSQVNHLYQQQADTKQSDQDWSKASEQEIINTIVNRYHAYLMQHLPEISQYVTKVARVHGSQREELVKLHEVFHQFKLEMEQHALKEEQQIFPLILQYVQNPAPELLQNVKDGIQELESEHVGAGNLLEVMRQLTHDYELPAEACMTYQLTFKKLMELEEDTFMHIHLENNILFPRILNQ
ncbi:iron-sulfur cluster repair di-iron protein [Ammoniphilus sp. YIM 78166]|uniref:iron-sulfur cluster repair di-iron protein n=1 Tax=Ammoniphilus sp. YIM 78166 TaxID=1644106 RepID=UPI001070620C|nr:iron-sulfur cluster repair di-iron protein [Ammoniphilus sp. YIM 78166]